MIINNFKNELNDIIENISKSSELESAIFDVNGHLLTCTKTYLKYKGETVHFPSLEEVIKRGDFVVNKPGAMDSCQGCRFKDNCPATIEILTCIKINEEVIGVISLTTFTEKGHTEMSSNISLYINLLKFISNIISNFLTSNNQTKKTEQLETIIEKSIDIIDYGIIIVNKEGIVVKVNTAAFKMLPICSIYSTNIQILFSEKICTKILDGMLIKKEIVKVYKSYKKISTIPMYKENIFYGAIIKIHDNYNDIVTLKNINNQSSLDKIIGSSEGVTEIKRQAIKVLNSSSTILITGETGTGKGMLAKAIHDESNRAKFPFIYVNCSSIPNNLFESELFGYDEGAFSGAKKGGKPGKFELAQNGTIFLDEICELPFFMQSKLLRVLQEFTIDRVGGIKPINLNVRVIAATNRNIEKMIEAGKFREDLYFRLNVIPLALLPLRERLNDIEALAYEFLNKYSNKIGKNIKEISEDVFNIFEDYRWPGNIRELENVIEYSINMEDGHIITVDSIPKRLIENHINNNNPILQAEYDIIIKTLHKHGWDVKGKKKAAEELGMGLRTLYRKLNKYKQYNSNVETKDDIL